MTTRFGRGVEGYTIAGLFLQAGFLTENGQRTPLARRSENSPKSCILPRMIHQVVLIPGDGIGPEVTAAVMRIMAAAEAPIRWIEHQAGLAAVEQGDKLLPPATLEAILEHGVALKGPCTTPVGTGFSSVNVQLRRKLDLYAAVRPVRSLDGVSTRFSDVDLVIIRENTEGLYSGIENEITPGVVTSLKVATETRLYAYCAMGFRFCHSKTEAKNHGLPQGQHHEADRWPIYPLRRPSSRIVLPTSRTRTIDHRRRMHEIDPRSHSI